MAGRRTKSLSTKVTEDEYAQLAARAGAHTISEWAREVLLAGTEPDPADRAILAEVVALRTILLNLHVTIANGHLLTLEQMQTLIDRADHDRWGRAQERFAAATAGRTP